MKFSISRFRWLILWATVSAMAAPPISPVSFENEQLHYNINWPSGLSLGEAAMSVVRSGKSAPELHFQFDLDAGVPGFPVADRYSSEASPEFCSSDFERNITHGIKENRR